MSLRRVNMVVSIFALCIAMLSIPFFSQGWEGGEPEELVKVCHATEDVNNPYVPVTELQKRIAVRDHDNHNGPLWERSMLNGWGDIIPPFTYENKKGKSVEYAGKNWTMAGQEIWYAHCNTKVSVTVTKVVNNEKGGTATTDDFRLFLGDIALQSGVEKSGILIGVYQVREEGPADGYEASFSGSCAHDGTLTLHALQNASCTITNTYVATTTPTPVFGCTDKEARNYDPHATKDDGSCEYGNGGGDQKVTLTVTITGDGEGRVEDNAERVFCANYETGTTTVCSALYDVGTLVTLSAIANEGSSFEDSWTVGAGTCNATTTPCQVTLLTDTALTAHFTKMSNGGNNGGNDNGNGNGSTQGSGNSGGGKKIELGKTSDSSSNTSNGEGGDMTLPDGEVLGENVTIPVGAPVTGAGGTSESSLPYALSFIGVVVSILALVFTRNAKNQQ